MNKDLTPASTREQPAATTPYDDYWYDKQFGYVLESARVYVAYLRQFLQPHSVLDVGCGRGGWLKAWQETGVTKLIGLDGHWNSQGKMIEPSIEFSPIDLNQRFRVAEPVDLAMTLEVAEHLLPSSAQAFVESLAAASDLVLFGAAYSYQGGTQHINEQPHSYWGRLFGACGLVPFDILRPVFWGDDRVCYWYRQNTFLYAKHGSAAYFALTAKGLAPLPDVAFMDCVHPTLYDMKVHAQIAFRAHLADLLPSFVRAMKRRYGGSEL